MAKIIFLKSTYFVNLVVPFLIGVLYNKITKSNRKGENKMNTDKIYAESIAKEYAPKDSSKIVALRKLDRKAKLPATIFTYTWGIVFALVFGTGLCLAMQVIGNGIIGMVMGIIIGTIGIVGCGVNYPIYKKMLENGKKKYAYEIVELAREISEEK